MLLKECSWCREVKHLNKFSKNKRNTDGLQSECKRCNKDKLDIKTRAIDTLPIYMHRVQCQSSKKRGHIPPSYSSVELKEWVMSQPLYYDIYNKWVNSGYDRWEKPSCDRIDDNIGYCFENIVLVSWKDNSERNHERVRTGDKKTTHKTIYQYTLDYEYVAEYFSARYAARATCINGGNIRACANPNISKDNAGGFIWSYKKLC